MRSRVGPAVTSTFSPRRSSRGCKMRIASATICSGSLMRPAPTSPHARKPLSGPIKRTPRFVSVRRLLCVASAVHMPVFIAGASKIGALVASRVVVSISSATPQASLAMRFAVAGAITKSCAFLASSTCSTSQRSGRAKVSVITGRPLSVSKVSGATNCAAFFVITTSISAPSFLSRETTSAAL